MAQVRQAPNCADGHNYLTVFRGSCQLAQMKSNWFSRFLEQLLAERYEGNESALARDIGEHTSNIHRWRQGRSPQMDAVEHVLRTFGGDITRALPDTDAVAESPPRYVFRDSGPPAPPTLPPILEDLENTLISGDGEVPHYAPLSTFVPEDDAMAPLYPSGSLVIISKCPKSVPLPPPGADCLVQVRHDPAERIRRLDFAGDPPKMIALRCLDLTQPTEHIRRADLKIVAVVHAVLQFAPGRPWRPDQSDS